MCVLCLKPGRMNETRQHLATGTEWEAPRTSARVTWPQGFPEKVTSGQGSAGGLGGAQKLHRPEGRGGTAGLAKQDGEHRGVGEGPFSSRGQTIRSQGYCRKGSNVCKR